MSEGADISETMESLPHFGEDDDVVLAEFADVPDERASAEDADGVADARENVEGECAGAGMEDVPPEESESSSPGESESSTSSSSTGDAADIRDEAPEKEVTPPSSSSASSSSSFAQGDADVDVAPAPADEGIEEREQESERRGPRAPRAGLGSWVFRVPSATVPEA
jgi:hypothetical protein